MSSQVVQNKFLKQPVWNVSREEAEKLLLKEVEGTFLFRIDPFALALEEILRRGLKKAIRCYTLTYRDPEGIVRDRTLVFTDRVWMFYDDDPKLTGPSWTSVAELLKSMESVVKYQLNT